MAGSTFVVLAPQSSHGVIFGKNTNRPDADVQEIVYQPSTSPSGKIQCTYIEVDCGDTGPTKSLILSKSSWTWGAQSGANECGVVIGTQAVYSKDTDGDGDMTAKRLLGVDLVRLGLERSSTAGEAVDVITNLLETYGQGGSSSRNSDQYHCNSFVIADGNSAWIVETTGKHWAAEELTTGCRSIGNIYTISNMSKYSDGLEDYAKTKGLWNGEGVFNFAAVFNTDDADRLQTHQNAVEQLTTATGAGEFKEINMFALLRDESVAAHTMGSQVSSLSASGPSLHWFTGTKNPRQSVFKPFVFTPNVVISKHTICPNKDEPHTLYSLHQAATSKEDVQSLLLSMEKNCVEEVDAVIETVGTDLSEFDELLKDCVETEVKFYR